MDLMKKIFGNKSRPGAADIARELDRSRAGIEEAKARVTASAAALADIATMTDAEHAAAEAEHAEAVRALARLEARIVGLQEAHTAALKTEADAALLARAQAAKRANEADAARLLTEYETAAASLANVLGKLKAIRLETDAVNDALRLNAVHPYVESYEALYRKEPDHFTPEQRETYTYISVPNRHGGMDEIPHRRGDPVPKYAQGPYTREVVTSRERHRIGAHVGSFEDIRLPPGRIGSAWHWPRNT